MAEFFPDDVIFEIFSRLPVKSVIRFRCVSKMWYSLISSRYFIATHLSRSLSNPQHPSSLLFYFYDFRLKNTRLTLHSYGDPFPRNHFTKHLDLSSPALDSLQLSPDLEIHDEEGFFAYPWDCTELSWSHLPINQFSLVVGSSNGLVCFANRVLSEGLSSYFILNPSINKFISIPNPTISTKTQFVGFGYDAKTDDYKLVRLAYPYGSAGICFDPVSPLVEIYTLSSRAWRPVMVPGPTYSIYMYFSVFFNGAVHWLAHTPPQQGLFRNVIAAFDMENEAFHEIAVPKSLEGHPLDMAVSVRDGSLALVPYNQFNEVKCVSVWVMKEYGVVESWIKVYNIIIDEGLHRVVGFGANGVLLVTSYARLLFHEPSSQRTMDLHTWVQPMSLYFDTYMESLVLLDVAD